MSQCCGRGPVVIAFLVELSDFFSQAGDLGVTTTSQNMKSVDIWIIRRLKLRLRTRKL